MKSASTCNGKRVQPMMQGFSKGKPGLCAMRMPLPAGYSVEVDSVDKRTWHQVIERFDDANIYQTWSYEGIRSGENNLSHLLLKKDGNVIAAAQAKITKIPFTRVGVAYVRWGPLWRLRGSAVDPEVFALAIRCLRNEYACKRQLSIRMLPRIFDDQCEVFEPILVDEQFDRVPVEEAQRTLLIPLEHSVEELRKGLEQKWRNGLNRAEKNNLRIEEGTDDPLFSVFLDIYAEMHGRKQFLKTSDVHQLRLIQADLPEALKMKIVIAVSDGRPAAGLICSKIGDMGIYLFGGTSNAGLSTNASYLLQWHILRWLRTNGATSYNLHGINPAKNPGTYRFKAGLSGKNGKDVRYMGAYDSSSDLTTRAIFRFAGSARHIYRKAKTAISEFRIRNE